MKQKLKEIKDRINAKISLFGKKKIISISLITACVALVVAVTPNPIRNMLASIYNVKEGSAAGVTLTTPKKVLLGDPNDSNWNQYNGATIYNWDNFEVTIDNKSGSKMTNISISMTGTGQMTGTNGGTSDFYCTQGFVNELENGSSETVKCNGVVKSAENYQDPTETMTISYSINGNIYNDTSEIEFYHRTKPINLENTPYITEPSAVEYEVWNNTGDQNEHFYVKISKDNVYMDITEDIWNQDIEYWYRSLYALGKEKYAVHVWGPQTGSSGGNVRGQSLYPRLWEYIQYTSAGSETDIITKNYDGSWRNDHENNNRLFGSAKAVTNGTVKVHTPIYAKYRKQGLVVWSDERDTYGNDFGANEEDTGYTHGKMSDVGFNLTVYDKTSLKYKINDVQSLADKFDDEIYDKTEINNALDYAESIYYKRETSQDEINRTITSESSEDISLAKFTSSYIPPKKPASYTELDTKIAEAKLIQNITSVGNHELYTENSWNALQNIILIAENFDRNYEIDKQNLVDTMTTTLVNAMTPETGGLVYHDGYYESIETALNGLKSKGITTDISSISGRDLEKVKVTVDGKEYDYYSEDSWNALQTAVNKITIALTKKANEQQYIEDVAQEIEDANIGLVISPADYSGLNTKIEEAQNIKNETYDKNHELYTSASWTNLQSKIVAAQNVPRNYTLENQHSINVAKEELETAMTVGENGLVYHDGYYDNVEIALNSLSENGISASLSNLNIINPQMTISGVNYNVFKASTFTSLQGSLNEIIQGKLANEQELIEQMASNVITAKNNLEANTNLINAISELITAYNEKNHNWYETNYINQIDAKIMEYNNDLDLTKASVRQTITQLNSLIEELDLHLLPADYSVLNQKISDAKLISNTTSVGNHKLYTTTSWDALQNTISNAEGLSRDLKKNNQNTIDDMANTLSTKMTVGENGLVYRSGYYENVELALNSLGAKGINVSLNNLVAINPSYTLGENNYNLYTEISFATLQTRLNAVDKTKNASEQELIEQMAANINNANNGLVINSEITTVVNNMLSEYSEKTKEWYEPNYINQINNKLAEYNNNSDLTNSEVRLVVSDLYNMIYDMNSHLLEGDYSQIDTKISEINGISNFTSRTNHEAVTEVINYIESHRNYKKDKQDQINQMYQNLVNAYNNLGADYTDLDLVIENFEENIEPSAELYDDTKYNDLLSSINAAREMSRDLKVSDQAQINSKKNEIINKIALLSFKKSDYSKLKEAVSKLPNDYSKFSASLKKEIEDLIEELNLFPDDLNIVYQSRVDEMTEKVNKILLKISESENSSNTQKDVASNTTIVVNQKTSNDKSTIKTKTSGDVSEEKDILKSVKINGKEVDLTTKPYKITVRSDVTKAKTEVELYNKKYKYEVFGGQKLSYGENEVTIIVTDNSNKRYSYVIYVTRKDPDNYLKTLEVEGASIDFDKTILEYKVKIDRKTKKLNLKAIAESKDSKVKIEGNNNLKNGSIIKIIVTSKDGAQREYKIFIEKEKTRGLGLLICAAISLIAFIGAIGYVIRTKNNDEK